MGIATGEGLGLKSRGIGQTGEKKLKMHWDEM